MVLKGVCGGDAWQGRADWPTGWVTEGARAGVGQQDRPCYSAQSAQELAVTESITACGWRRGQGSLPSEGWSLGSRGTSWVLHVCAPPGRPCS